jgi:hypothetical protein
LWFVVMVGRAGVWVREMKLLYKFDEGEVDYLQLR